MSKIAIIQCADTGPLESIVTMLRSVGYTCEMPRDDIKRRLREIGCDTVLNARDLIASGAYEHHFSMNEASLGMMSHCKLFVDIKGVRSYPKIIDEWPNLEGKVLWYRINGGEPEHIIKAGGMDCGDEKNPPCPILTPNQWYKELGPWSDRAYACWPPFVQFHEYLERNRRKSSGNYEDPICLIHNFKGWGYGSLIDSLCSLGVKIYGGGSPAGILNHRRVAKTLSRCKALVHAKGTDAPGYALYEALAAACPIIVSERFIMRSHMKDLLIPGETCLGFYTVKSTSGSLHQGFNQESIEQCTVEVREALEQLSDPCENQRIGMAGHERLKELMWNVERDGKSLQEFMVKHFGE